MELASPKSKHICNSHKRTHKPKIAKELALPTQRKIVFKKFPNALKQIKIHRQTTRQTQQIMTQKINIDKTYSNTVDRRPAGNSTYKKIGGSVLRMTVL
jgi:hypothetical protein